MAVAEMEIRSWLLVRCQSRAVLERELRLAACYANNPDLFRFVRRQGITMRKARLKRRAQFACADEVDGSECCCSQRLSLIGRTASRAQR